MAAPDFDFAGLASAAKHPATAGVAGALLSLRLIPGSSIGEKVWTLASGAVVAFYAAPAACDYLQIGSEAAIGLVGFLSGLFGLALIHQMMEAIKQTPWGEIVASWLRRKGGD